MTQAEHQRKHSSLRVYRDRIPRWLASRINECMPAEVARFHSGSCYGSRKKLRGMGEVSLFLNNPHMWGGTQHYFHSVLDHWGVDRNDRLTTEPYAGTSPETLCPDCREMLADLTTRLRLSYTVSWPGILDRFARLLPNRHVAGRMEPAWHQSGHQS